MKKIITRLRNKRIAAAVISGVLLILVNIGLIDNAVIVQFEPSINLFLGLLVTLGILSDPESHIKE